MAAQRAEGEHSSAAGACRGKAVSEIATKTAAMLGCVTAATASPAVHARSGSTKPSPKSPTGGMRQPFRRSKVDQLEGVGSTQGSGRSCQVNE